MRTLSMVIPHTAGLSRAGICPLLFSRASLGRIVGGEGSRGTTSGLASTNHMLISAHSIGDISRLRLAGATHLALPT